MARTKGKTPSLLALSTGTPVAHTCGKATPCGRCGEIVTKGKNCFQIPKAKSGFTRRPIFCTACTVAIVAQTRIELLAIEEEVRSNG